MSDFSHTVNLPESLTYNGVTINLAGESPDRIQNAIAYLLNYGFGKSLQDSVAGVKKELEGKGESAETIAATIAKDMAERAEAILSGSVSARGPRLSGPDAIRREVVEMYFRAWAKAQASKGKALPSLKAMFNVTAKDATKEQKEAVAKAVDAIRQRYAAANTAKIEAEVARRLALQSELADEDVELDFTDGDAGDAGE